MNIRVFLLIFICSFLACGNDECEADPEICTIKSDLFYLLMLKMPTDLISPDIIASKYGITVSITNINGEISDIGVEQINVYRIQDSNQFKVRVTNITMAGSAKINLSAKDKVFGIEINLKTVDVSIEANDLAIKGKLNRIKVENGKNSSELVDVDISFNPSQIVIEIDHGILNNIVQLFVLDLIKGPFMTPIKDQISDALTGLQRQKNSWYAQQNNHP